MSQAVRELKVSKPTSPATAKEKCAACGSNTESPMSCSRLLLGFLVWAVLRSPVSIAIRGSVRHRVLNDASVAASLKRRSLAEAMEKAATNRESHVAEVR